MTDTNPRYLLTEHEALLARLSDVLWNNGLNKAAREADAAVERLHNFLAQPEPKWPTDEEIEQFADELRLIKNPARVRVVCDDAGFVKEHAYDECGFRIHDEVGFARAVLARWGK